jgi:tetratricopeptide (TPR) repeat protein
LALRLGLVRAARLLLRLGQQTEVAPIAHFDLGQACEILGDLTAAEAAFARYAAVRPTDPDAWRRLLLCRLRLGHFTVAEETLKRYRAAGGRERDLAERFLSLMIRPTAQGQQRINLVGWLCARLPEAFRRRLPISGLVNEIILRRCDSLTITDSARLAAATQGLRAELQCAPATVPENRLDDALRVALLCLPLLPRPRESAPPAAAGSDPAAVLALQALAAISLWATLTGIPAQRLGEMEDSVNLRDLAHFALTARPAPPHPLP